MNETALTDTEPPNVIQRIVNAWDCCATCAGGILAQHTAARVAEAVDRERAAWVAKIAEVTREHQPTSLGRIYDRCSCGWYGQSLSSHLRALLAADDTEAKR